VSPKGNHRIDARGSARGEPHANEGDHDEDQRHDDEGDRIAGGHTEEEGGEEPCQAPRGRHGHHGTEQRQPHALPVPYSSLRGNPWQTLGCVQSGCAGLRTLDIGRAFVPRRARRLRVRRPPAAQGGLSVTDSPAVGRSSPLPRRGVNDPLTRDPVGSPL
jgi:hypothetical protein